MCVCDAASSCRLQTIEYALHICLRRTIYIIHTMITRDDNTHAHTHIRAFESVCYTRIFSCCCYCSLLLMQPCIDVCIV